MKGVYFDGFTLLKGEKGSRDATVIFDRYCCWRIGYHYENWDLYKYEFIPITAFEGLDGYLSFIKNASIEQLRMYFKIPNSFKEMENHYNTVLGDSSQYIINTFNVEWGNE